MVVGQIIGQILCDGIFSLFLLPLFPKKDGKVELESTNESSIIDKSVNKSEWWDVDTSEDNMNNIRKTLRKDVNIILMTWKRIWKEKFVVIITI